MRSHSNGNPTAINDSVESPSDTSLPLECLSTSSPSSNECYFPCRLPRGSGTGLFCRKLEFNEAGKLGLSRLPARQKWRFSNDEDEGDEEEPNPNKKLPCSPCSAGVTSQPDFTIDSGQCPRLEKILDAFYQKQLKKIMMMKLLG